MLQPQQQRLETQTLQAKQAATSPWARQALPMKPHPYIAQDQRQRHIEQPDGWVARAGGDARLMQLAKAALDAESLAISVGHPTRRIRLQAPVGINPGHSSSLSSLATQVAA